ncbi:MAG: type II toxin-antitoxin system HigB family toxin [Anaerolineaceae bacterium]
MQIVGIEKITEFIARYPDSKASLTSWVAHVKMVKWNNSAEVKQSSRKADLLKDNRVVFNIQHNNYRLVVKINYPYYIVEIRFLNTHKAYSRINAETV